MHKIEFDKQLILFTTFFSIVVVLLGAFCRLADSGLGCPDWPGCYGHLLSVPQSTQEVAIATGKYPTMPPLAPERMWPEMIHRYFAGTLGLCVFFITLRSWMKKQLIKPCLILSAIVIMQATLGMWTVTWKLHPLVVMGHLLGGFTLTGILFWLTLHHWFPSKKQISSTSTKLAYLMIVTIFLQIMLGGWTSANYAALICTDFPFCNNGEIPAMDFINGFTFIQQIGKNYEFGLLETAARVAIHMTHRLGAIITLIILTYSSYYIFKNNNIKIKTITAITLLVLIVQIILGILNIKLILPISIAVTHNGVGLLLLLCAINLYYFTKQQS